MSQQEIENQIIELFSLLEETFKGKDNKKIKESMNKLNEIYKKNPSNINILFLALSYKSIAGRELTLNNHKSVALYLKNLLLSRKNENPEIIFSYLNKIFELIFEKSKENPYLNNYSIISSFQSTIQNLLSFKNMLDKKDYLEKLFNSILNYIQNENSEYFLAIAKSVILFCTSLLSSKCADDTNYNQLINSYYIPIIDIIFSNVPKYLNPKNNMYNIEFITIIKLLLDGFYNNLQKTKGIFQNDTIKEISMMFFKKYGSYCYELLQLMPEFDLDTKNKFGSPNPIIVFNQNEKLCYELNNMKGKAIQFISFITQISTLKEQYENEDIKNYIKDKDLQQIIKDIMALIMRSFQDILNSKEKYNYIRKNFDEKNDEEDITNMLLYQICVFLTRALIREPIKSELKSNMKQFLLNIFFPLIVSSEDEINFIENDPEGYHQYINDITFKFKNQNFRTSGCFLVKKICDEYEDIDNFVKSGKNLYICSTTPGNAKTTWAAKLMLNYFNKVWPNSYDTTRGLFVHIPTLMLDLKKFDAIPEYINRIKDADLVIWDDLAATNKLTEYEHEQLLQFIDYRIQNELSNIYTSNITDPTMLIQNIGARLASRVYTGSKIITFIAKDFRAGGNL